MGKKEARFICIHNEVSFTLGVLRVLVDRETMVNCLWCREGGGKPVITPRGALPEG